MCEFCMRIRSLETQMQHYLNPGLIKPLIYIIKRSVRKHKCSDNATMVGETAPRHRKGCYCLYIQLQINERLQKMLHNRDIRSFIMFLKVSQVCCEPRAFNGCRLKATLRYKGLNENLRRRKVLNDKRLEILSNLFF